jgi:predicted PurR-regulated permease PerM
MVSNTTPRWASRVVLLALIVVVGGLFYRMLAPYLLPLFLAAVTAVICEPLFNRFLSLLRDNREIAAGATVTCLLLAVLTPLLVGTAVASAQLYELVQTAPDNPNWKKTMRLLKEELEHPDRLAAMVSNWTGNPVDADELANDLQRQLQSLGTTVWRKTSGATGSLLASAPAGFVYIIAVYFFLLDGRSMMEDSDRMLPFNVEYRRALVTKFEQAVRGVVTATFAAAMAQGVATAAALYVCGFRQFMILTMLGTIMSLVPVVGTWLVWGPAAVWLWWDGQYGWAIGLAVWGILVVGILDNVVRAYVLNTNVELHPLLATLSVLGGLEVLGLWGVFVGPIAATCLQTLARILTAELGSPVAESQAHDPTGAAAPGAESPGTELPGQTPSSAAPAVSEPLQNDASATSAEKTSPQPATENGQR